jgi:hypothetical protein
VITGGMSTIMAISGLSSRSRLLIAAMLGSFGRGRAETSLSYLINVNDALAEASPIGQDSNLRSVSGSGRPAET